MEDFHERLKEKFSDDNETNFDSLIYVLSCHGDGKNLVYDRDGEWFALSFIYHEFDNQECRQLRNKPKIYLFDIDRVSIANTKNMLHDRKTNNEEEKMNVKSIKKVDQHATNQSVTTSKNINIEDKNCRFCPSAQLPMKWNSKCLSNGSIFIYCFFFCI